MLCGQEGYLRFVDLLFQLEECSAKGELLFQDIIPPSEVTGSSVIS